MKQSKNIIRKGYSKNTNWHKSSNIEFNALFNIRNDFKNESDLKRYIIFNIERFCSEVLGDIYVSHEEEFYLEFIDDKIPFINKRKNFVKIDIMIFCNNNTYCVELKNDKITNPCSLIKAISQLMFYEELLIENGMKAQMVLLSTKYVEILFRILQRYRLNYRYILFNKQYNGELLEVNDEKK